MDKSLNRTVTFVKLHEGVFAPGGAGELGKVFPPSGNITLKECHMVTGSLGLIISGIRLSNLAKFEILVPWPNVAQASLIYGECDEDKPVTAVAKTARPSVQKNSTPNKTEQNPS